MTERLYTPAEVAALFQLHPETVREHIRKGDWPHTKFGPRSARFTETHIEQILTSHDKQPQAPRPSRRRRQI